MTNELRKMYSVPGPAGPDDQGVLSRRTRHEKFVKWGVKWLAPMHVFFAFIGFSVVLLPVLLSSWRATVDRVPLLSQVFHDYSTLSGWSMHQLFFLTVPAFAMTWVKRRPGTYQPSYQDVIRLQAYPRTKEEEVPFWIDAFTRISMTTIWLIFPFGLVAYFIRIGK